MFTMPSVIHLIIRLLVALVASHLIVVHDAEETWMELFTKDYYYLSLLYSMIIAFVLIESVYQITQRLNSIFLDFSITRARLKSQFYIGFVCTGIFAFVLAAVLFWLNGQNIFESNYFEKLYASILLFIFATNVIYVLYYHYGFVPKTRYQIVNVQSAVDLEKRSIPALIYYENRVCIAVDFEGISSILPNIIEESMRMLEPNNYFQINRRVIIHRSVISSVKPFRTRLLKIELRIAVDLPDTVDLIVSKRKMVIFKQWLDVKSN